MQFKDDVKRALDTGDAKLATRITEYLRNGNLKLRDGTPVYFTYSDVMNFISKILGRPRSEVEPEWESLLSEGE